MTKHELERTICKRIHKKNWQAWETFDNSQRERVKRLMKSGFKLHNALSIVRLSD